MQQLEKCLKKYAESLGVKIQYKAVASTQEAHDLFPACKVFIAADSAHSTMRHSLFGDGQKAVEREDAQYTVDLKYTVRGKKEKPGMVDVYANAKATGYICFESAKYNPETNTTDISLRFFVDKEGSLTIASLGSHKDGTAYVKHKIKSVDRLVGNSIFHKEMHIIYQDFFRPLIACYSVLSILVDWSGHWQDIRNACDWKCVSL